MIRMIWGERRICKMCAKYLARFGFVQKSYEDKSIDHDEHGAPSESHGVVKYSGDGRPDKEAES